VNNKKTTQESGFFIEWSILF